MKSQQKWKSAHTKWYDLRPIVTGAIIIAIILTLVITL